MTGATHVYLVRHGVCEGGTIFRGTTDSALSEPGRQQMRQALAQFTASSLDLLISSPLLRCQQPAQHFCLRQGLPLHIEEDFREIHFGQWEGQPVADIERIHPDRINRFWRDPVSHPPPDGETMAAFQQRVVRAWQRMLDGQRGKRVLLLSHGGVMRLILAQLLGMPLRPLSHLHVPHACISHIAIYHSPGKPDWPQLMFHNGTVAHG